MWPTEDKGKWKWNIKQMSQAMKKWINEKRMGVMELTMQLWKEIAIAINWKYLKKRFQWDEENKEKINEDKVEDMQVSHKLHIAGMIYAHGIQK